MDPKHSCLPMWYKPKSHVLAYIISPVYYITLSDKLTYCYRMASIVLDVEIFFVLTGDV